MFQNEATFAWQFDLNLQKVNGTRMEGSEMRVGEELGQRKEEGKEKNVKTVCNPWKGGWQGGVEVVVERAHRTLRPQESLFLVVMVLCCTSLCVYVTTKHLQLVSRVQGLEDREEEARGWRRRAGEEARDQGDATQQLKLVLLRQEAEVEELGLLIKARQDSLVPLQRAKRATDCGCVGMPGPPGPLGMPGRDGMPGPLGVGGPQGPKGEQGEPGYRFMPRRNNQEGRGRRRTALTRIANKYGYAEVVAIKGDSGNPGPPGPQGLPGPMGMPGFDGVPGSMGPQGAKGEYGPQGMPGDRGLPGLDGAPAHQMQQDAASRSFTFDAMPGPPGPPGKPGQKGETGSLAVLDKNEMVKTVVGPPGPKGEFGPEGPSGVRGRRGKPGKASRVGKPGERIISRYM